MSSPARLRNTPLNALRTFEVAARHLSFAQAAADLGVTASAVSIQIRRLETDLGRPLFHRGHRRVDLTETGAKFAAELSTVFADLERIFDDVAGRPSGTLEISAMPSFATRWLARRISDFARANPGLPIRVAGADSLADIERGGVDVGLRYGPGGYAPLHAERLATATAYPVCSPGLLRDHRARLRTPSGLLALPLISDETSLRAEGLPSWARWFAHVGVKASAPAGPTFESGHMALTAALAGQGVALGLTPLINADLRSGALVLPFASGLTSPYDFWFLCRKDRFRDLKIRRFRDWIFAAIAEDSINPAQALATSSISDAGP